jgi:hypothetical protein
MNPFPSNRAIELSQLEPLPSISLRIRSPYESHSLQLVQICRVEIDEAERRELYWERRKQAPILLSSKRAASNAIYSADVLLLATISSPM